MTFDGFKSKIRGTLQGVKLSENSDRFEFPAFHQKEYAYRFVNKEKQADLLIGDTGTMKTGASLYAMEAAGAKHTLFVAPASFRGDLSREIKDKCRKDVSILAVRSQKQLEEILSDEHFIRPKYTVISYSLLSRLNQNGHLIDRLVDKF